MIKYGLTNKLPGAAVELNRILPSQLARKADIKLENVTCTDRITLARMEKVVRRADYALKRQD